MGKKQNNNPFASNENFEAFERENYLKRMAVEDAAQIADSALVEGELTQAGQTVAGENNNGEVSE